jgi:hypothetical protein
MTFENLKTVLQEVLISDALPFQAGTEYATRGSDLATGKSGLLLALTEAGIGIGGLKINSSQCSNVFTAELNLSSSDFSLDNAQQTSNHANLGDIFDGLASESWTNLVLNRLKTQEITDISANAVIRPGLGHGDLIRDLVNWASTWPHITEDFVASETVFSGLGWCNGKAGLLAAYSVAFQIRPSSDLQELIEKLAAEILREVPLEREGEYNLCHGWAGALVVVGSVARLLDIPDFHEKARRIYQDKAKPDSLINLPPGIFLDTTWLTGASGMLWGWLALHKPPIINPLVPHYSRTYSSQET